MARRAEDEVELVGSDKSMTEHIADWRESLRSKGDTERHAQEGTRRVLKLIALAKVDRLSELSISRIEAAVLALRDLGLARRTIHHYVRLAKNFSTWLWKDRRARENKLQHL